MFKLFITWCKVFLFMNDETGINKQAMKFYKIEDSGKEQCQ